MPSGRGEKERERRLVFSSLSARGEGRKRYRGLLDVSLKICLRDSVAEDRGDEPNCVRHSF